MVCPLDNRGYAYSNKLYSCLQAIILLVFRAVNIFQKSGNLTTFCFFGIHPVNIWPKLQFPSSISLKTIACTQNSFELTKVGGYHWVASGQLSSDDTSKKWKNGHFSVFQDLIFLSTVCSSGFVERNKQMDVQKSFMKLLTQCIGMWWIAR